jgi:hypothetical protein
MHTKLNNCNGMLKYRIIYHLTVTVLFMLGALSDERTGLSFVYAAGPCQRSLSRVRVLWDSRPYFTGPSPSPSHIATDGQSVWSLAGYELL